MDGQAGILAQKLEEGIPCPVCGALKHPSPSLLPEELPTEAEVKEAKSLGTTQKKSAINVHKAINKQPLVTRHFFWFSGRNLANCFRRKPGRKNL